MTIILLEINGYSIFLNSKKPLSIMENFYLFVSKENFETIPEKIKIVNVGDPEILRSLKKSKRVRYIPALCIKGENYETIIYGKSRIQDYLMNLENMKEEDTRDEEFDPLDWDFPEQEKLPEPTPENIEPIVEEYKKKFTPDFNDH